MKINELLVENEQLDELNLKGLGQGLGKAIGGVAGGVVQGAKNVWSGMKQGYTGAQQALAPDGTPVAGGAAGGTAPAPAASGAPAAAPAASGGTAPAASGGATGGPGEVAGNNLLARAQQGTTQDPAAQVHTLANPKDPATGGAPAPASADAPAAPGGGAAGGTPAPTGTPPAGQTPPAGGEAPNPAADQQSKIGVGQINKIIPTLRTRDLNSVKKNVDATIAKKTKAPAAPAAGAAPAPAAGPTQAEIDADRERLMGPDNGGANESRVIKFRSRFLGMDI